jgi:hypothetical protein
MTSAAPVQLLVFRFRPDGRFEGGLGGALERAESGGALRILRMLFVGRDPDTGDLETVDLHDGARGLIEPLLSFRLDPARRREISAKALRAEGGGLSGEALLELGARLEAGAAIVAVLVEHRWSAVLADAVTRSGGWPIADEPVSAGGAADLERRLLAVTRRPGPAPSAPAGQDC